MAPVVVTVSQSDEELILTGTPSRSASVTEVASCFEESSDAESSHPTGSNKSTASGIGSEGATISDAPDHPTSSDEVQSLKDALSPPK